ncbi:hypothetical protein ACQKM2_10800 [Streptomyces sp. NPDC004126]
MSEITLVDNVTASFARVATTVTPSTELLDRALAGWERFLSTFEKVSDE